ncbi:MAG: hypothetical protein V1872_09640 [bacterium]
MQLKTFSKYYLFILFFFVILLVNVSFYVVVTANKDNPHKFMLDEKTCLTCHEKKPDREKDDYLTVSFNDDIVQLCMNKCHTKDDIGRSHPVDLRPPRDMDIPEDLHLDYKNNITCATCHDPHSDWKSSHRMVGYDDSFDDYDKDGKKARFFRSFFLRRRNVDSDLCLTCHKDF